VQCKTLQLFIRGSHVLPKEELEAALLVEASMQIDGVKIVRLSNIVEAVPHKTATELRWRLHGSENDEEKRAAVKSATPTTTATTQLPTPATPIASPSSQTSSWSEVAISTLKETRGALSLALADDNEIDVTAAPSVSSARVFLSEIAPGVVDSDASTAGAATSDKATTASARFENVLVATGRAPNVSGMGLEAAEVKFDARLGVDINDRMQTTQSHVGSASALGDVHLCSLHSANLTINMQIYTLHQ
jgi:pyruvate/2-oxoglutarate dehydrogenase complex dihydrolipoamide dehydrogenase (E3) component